MDQERKYLVNRKKTLGVTIITLIIVVVAISPIGPAYGHVSCPYTGGGGQPFVALWAAVCDLQGQIDNIQNTTPVTKQVEITSAPCNNDATHPTPYGWCPDGIKYKFLINDPAVTTQSVIATTTVPPTGVSEAPVKCSVESVKFVEGTQSGFFVLCDTSPPTGTALNYIVFNPPNSVSSPGSGSSSTPAVDNSASSIIDGDVSREQSVTLSTSNSNDIIFVEVGNGDSKQVQSISDSAGLTWSPRTVYYHIADGDEMVELWYAIASSPLSSDTITVKMNSQPSAPWSVISFGISNANTSSPFDGANDVTNTNSGGTSASVTATTNNSNEILIGSLVLDSSNSPPIPSGMTLIAAPQLNPPNGHYRGAVAIETVSTAGNYPVGFTWSNNHAWGIIATAVKPN